MGPFCLCSALPVVCFVAGIYNVFPSFIEDVMRLAGEIEKKKTKKSSACTGGALYRPLIKVSLRVSRLTGKYVVWCGLRKKKKHKAQRRKYEKGQDGGGGRLTAPWQACIKKLLPTCFADVVDALLREGRGGAQRSGCTSDGAGRPRVVITRSRIRQ